MKDFEEMPNTVRAGAKLPILSLSTPRGDVADDSKPDMAYIWVAIGGAHTIPSIEKLTYF